VGGTLLALAGILGCWVHWEGSLPGDRDVAEAVSRPWTGKAYVETGSRFFDGIATPIVAFVIVTFGMWTIWRRVDRRSALGLGLASLVVIPSAAVKAILGPTPLWVSLNGKGANYPSGHVAFTTAAIGYMAVIGARRRQPEVPVAAGLIIAGMGLTRVTSRQHLVSDVIGGGLLGAGWLVLVLLWVDRTSPDPPPAA